MIFLVPSCLFCVNPKDRVNQNVSISSAFNQNVRCNNLTLPTADTKVSKVKNNSDFEKRINFVPAKLDEGNEKTGTHLADSDDSFAPCNTESCYKVLSKHNKCGSINVPSLENLDSFIASEYIVNKNITSFPNGSGACSDTLAAQVLKDLVCKSNGSAGLEILKSLTKLVR